MARLGRTRRVGSTEGMLSTLAAMVSSSKRFGVAMVAKTPSVSARVHLATDVGSSASACHQRSTTSGVCGDFRDWPN